MKYSLPLVANGAPALLDDRWLVRITSERRNATATHEVEIQLVKAMMPTVPVDFMWIIWRVMAPSAPVRLYTQAIQVLADAAAAPGAQPSWSMIALSPEATWRTRAGRRVLGVCFQLDIMPVWRPTPKT